MAFGAGPIEELFGKRETSNPANTYLNTRFHLFDKHNEGNEAIPESKVKAVCSYSLWDLKADKSLF